MREERELFNEKCERVGQTYFVGDEIPKGLYHMVVMIAIQNSDGDFLMQKRAPGKGEEWAVAGGHLKVGETITECAINEIFEEMGLKLNELDLNLFASGFDGHHCFNWFYAKKDFDINKLVLQESEVSEVKWFSKNQIKDMIKTKMLSKNQINFIKSCFNYLKLN